MPPVWADRLFSMLCPAHLHEELSGDLYEQFIEDVAQAGEENARRRYVLEVLKFARPYFLRRKLQYFVKSFHKTEALEMPQKRRYSEDNQPFLLSPDMIRNYFKVARRNLIRNKSYTFINTCGLMLGMTCAILIYALVSYHLSFDDFHSKANRIYRVTSELHDEKLSKYSTVPAPLGAAVQQDYSFVEKSARIINFDGIISLSSSAGTARFQEPNGVAYIDPAFFEIMDFPLVQGNPNTILTEPNTAVISEKLAMKYFKTLNAVGKRFRLDNKTDFTVTGILKDIPDNTDQRQEVYLSYPTISQTNPWLDFWGGIYGGSHCYILLKSGVSASRAEKMMAGLSTKYYSAEDAKRFRFKLQPFSHVHLNQEIEGNSARNQLFALSLIGIFLIVTACVNFINLATAQALGRSKEIGIRKVLGSIRGQLFWQFIAETSVVTIIAFVAAVGLAYLALPHMNEILQTRVSIDTMWNLNQLAFLLLLLVVVIFVSGSYPGLILAGFQPIAALKGKLTQRNVGGFSMRKGLVVTQFAISQTLLIGTIVITSQMEFNRQSDMGFDKQAIVMLPVPDTKPAKTSAMSARISELPGIEKITFCNAPPASPQNNFDTGIRYASRTEPEKFTIYFKAGDPNYLSTFGLELLAGRNLVQSDTVREYLFNETAVRKLGLTSPQEVLGKSANINGMDGIIVGVIKDFHSASFRQQINPLCLSTKSDKYGICAVKISSQNLPATLTALEKVWKQTNPEYIYGYEFLDEHLAHFYEGDDLMLKMMRFFASIAIVIGCLGLYGLISFMAAQKTKEIGVRKTLGAGVASIIWLFGKQFTQLLLIAFVIAAPIAWWVMNQYLSEFQYHIKVGGGIFLSAIGITFIIAILTVGYRSLRAAHANPVKSLRSE